jgi:hypothetical protein
MRIRFAVALAAILLVSVLASHAQASSPIYVYSPVLSKPWAYVCQASPCYYDHWDAYQQNSYARDISGGTWSTSDPITFMVSSAANVSAKVVNAQINCPVGGPDYYVMLEIYGDGLYYGRADYVHLRSLNVSANTWISPGTTLGYPQDTASYYNGQTCWTGLHVHLGRSSTGQWGDSYVLTFPQGVPMSPSRRASLDAMTPRGPVTK